MNFHRLPVLALCLLCLTASAAPLAVGDVVPLISAKDQFGKEFALTTNVQVMLIATERACAKAANQKLAEQGAGFMEKHGAVFLMDIHSMPSVARWFAFPQIRKYPHRVVLVDSEGTLAPFPVKTNCVTVVELTPVGRIKKVSFWNSESEPVSDYVK